MTTRSDFHRHKTVADNLDAIPFIDGAFSLDDAIAGDNGQGSEIYVFDELDNAYDYEIRIRSGAEPAESDFAKGVFRKEIAAAGGGSDGDELFGIIVTCQDQDANAVVGARVAIVGTPRAQNTKTLGTTRFNVDDNETYTLIVAVPASYETPDPVNVTVSGADEPVTITIQRTTPAATTDPAKCTVTCNVTEQYGAPVEEAEVRALVKRKPAFSVSGQSLVINPNQTAQTTDENGQVTFDLHRGLEYIFRVTVDGVTTEFTRTIPDQGSYVATIELE